MPLPPCLTSLTGKKSIFGIDFRWSDHSRACYSRSAFIIGIPIPFYGAHHWGFMIILCRIGGTINKWWEHSNVSAKMDGFVPPEMAPKILNGLAEHNRRKWCRAEAWPLETETNYAHISFRFKDIIKKETSDLKFLEQKTIVESWPLFSSIEPWSHGPWFRSTLTEVKQDDGVVCMCPRECQVNH